MIRAWRLVKARRAKEAFSGEGARVTGGRWNHSGVAAVYLADSLALAALEVFVHVGAAHRGMQLVAIAADIPDDWRVEDLGTRLPSNWRHEPPTKDSQELGTAWLKGLKAPLLKVPSAIVPVEHNFMLNPLHPEAQRLTIHKPTPFTFDPRMWK